MCFNPHPARRPDATRGVIDPYLLAWWLFQSSSGQKAGCNSPSSESVGLNNIVFQSSSGQKAGCNLRAVVSVDVPFVFQSSSGQKAGCNACI